MDLEVAIGIATPIILIGWMLIYLYVNKDKKK